MRIYYREKRYICGDYIDIDIYPVFPSGKGRGKRRKESSAVQKRLNEKNARKKLLRLIHTNFTDGDLEVTFTYRDEFHPESEEQAKRDIQNFMRRARRLYKKAGIDLKYIWVMEKGRKTGRFHFHTFMSAGVDRSLLESLWGYGYANSVALRFDEKEGAKGIVWYDLKDSPLLYRRWSGSKNLKKPIEKKNDSIITRRAAKEIFEKQEYPDAVRDAYKKFEERYRGFDIAEVQGESIDSLEFSDVFGMENKHNSEYYISLRLYRKRGVSFGTGNKHCKAQRRAVSPPHRK